MESFSGRVAVVTGGASGIGRGLATAFRDAGASVVIGDIEQGALDATAAELGVAGVRCDVSSEQSVFALRDVVIERFGRADVVCLNAGVGGGGLIVDCTRADWEWVLGVNLWGVIDGVRAFLPGLVEQGSGHLVLTASVAGLTAGEGIGPYNASKYAVVGIAETLRRELDGTGVGVSVLCPGYVQTNIFTSQRNRPAHLANDAPKPMARLANQEIIEAMLRSAQSPEQVAATVLDAIRHDRFWILTHPELLDGYAERSSEILASGQPDPALEP
jgi:NAD(P)-dependent dehydrogenase (short-subunit alcohol dehydrogenase family)